MQFSRSVILNQNLLTMKTHLCSSHPRTRHSAFSVFQHNVYSFIYIYIFFNTRILITVILHTVKYKFGWPVCVGRGIKDGAFDLALHRRLWKPRTYEVETTSYRNIYNTLWVTIYFPIYINLNVVFSNSYDPPLFKGKLTIFSKDLKFHISYVLQFFFIILPFFFHPRPGLAVVFYRRLQPLTWNRITIYFHPTTYWSYSYLMTYLTGKLYVWLWLILYFWYSVR